MLAASFVVAAHAQKKSGQKEQVITIPTTVQAIDMEKRIVTVKNEKGEPFDLQVGSKLNLSSLKIGDKVIVKYQKSLAYEVLKPGETPKPNAAAEVKDAGSRSKLIRSTVTIQDIDKNTGNITAKTGDGRLIGYKVKEPSVLNNIKVGDQVEVVYKEAVAISIERVK